MSDLNDTTPGRGTACSRRTVLRATGALAGGAATIGVTTAQNGTSTDEQSTTDGGGQSRVTTLGVTPEQEDVQGDLVGMWIHVGPETDPIEAGIADECDIVDWGDEDTIAYDVQLIDRRADPYQRSIELYLPRRVEIGSGDLFIINEEVPCESGYIGIELEQIGARNVDVGVKSGEGLTETDVATQAGGPSGTAGPGFGWIAGLGGLLGGGWLLRRGGGD